MASSGRELKVRFQEPSIVIQRKENDARNQAQEANAHLQALRLTSNRLALSLSSSLNGVHQTLKEIKADVKVGSRELIHRYLIPRIKRYMVSLLTRPEQEQDYDVQVLRPPPL